jgi:2-keto-4-pentenoate hydratase/2-oxohepta-3-ene-1,7-dioic acid hydratase in catechol pathway
MSNEAVPSEWAERFNRPDPKIVWVGLSYRSHAGELGAEPPKAPLLFGKFASTLIADGDPIVLPPGIGHVDPEAELAVVIGERATRVPEGRARWM